MPPPELSEPVKVNRLGFIDFTRGLVMILMAWDHVSGFWNQLHGGLEGILPYRNPNLDLVSFMSRFITHWCAPTFIFLSGVSLALSVKKRLSLGDSQLDISLHIIKRGLVLLTFAILLEAPAFDLPYLYFGVISCIGACLTIFSVYRRLPTMAIFAVSLIIILNHQWLDLGFIPMDAAWGHYLRRIVHEPGYTWPPYFSLYPVIPWVGVMGLGWVFGTFLNDVDKNRVFRLKLPLIATGIASITLFFVVRYFNGYGNLVRRWSGEILDWLYLSKYPPDMAFLLWTLGGMCLFLAIGLLIDQRGWFDRNIVGVVHTFGRTPLFFYLTHIWLYRLRLPGVPTPFYLDLPQTLGFWAVGLIVLWLLCSGYERLKRRYLRFLQAYMR